MGYLRKAQPLVQAFRTASTQQRQFAQSWLLQAVSLTVASDYTAATVHRDRSMPVAQSHLARGGIATEQQPSVVLACHRLSLHRVRPAVCRRNSEARRARYRLGHAAQKLSG